MSPEFSSRSRGTSSDSRSRLTTSETNGRALGSSKLLRLNLLRQRFVLPIRLLSCCCGKLRRDE